MIGLSVRKYYGSKKREQIGKEWEGRPGRGYNEIPWHDDGVWTEKIIPGMDRRRWNVFFLISCS